MERTFKQKWDNYWYYYKYHTIIGILVLLCVVFGISQCGHGVETDLQIALVGEAFTPVEISSEELDAVGTDYLKDATGDSLVHLKRRIIKFTGDDADTEQSDYQTQQYMEVDLVSGESRLYLVDPAFCAYYEDQEVLRPLDDLLGDSIPDGAYRGQSGKVLAVPIKNTALLERMGVYTEPGAMMLCVRDIVEPDRSIKHIEEIEQNAILLLKELMK